MEEGDKKMTLIHRGVEPRNILFNKGTVKLANFGLGKFIDSITKAEPLSHSTCAVQLYSSPQILHGDDYSFKCDIWSLGCVMYECLYGNPPYNGMGEIQLLKQIKTKPLELPKVGKETQDLIKKMLAFEEKDRISWKEIHAHPAFLLKK